MGEKEITRDFAQPEGSEPHLAAQKKIESLTFFPEHAEKEWEILEPLLREHVLVQNGETGKSEVACHDCWRHLQERRKESVEAHDIEKGSTPPL